jgi:amino acid adenylation domain-containing protein
MTTLQAYARDVLGTDVDGDAFAARSFIELGGDSLRALRLAALARENLGVRVPVGALLGAAPLAQVLAESAPVVATTIEPRAAGSVSHAQRGMWLIERVAGGSPYNLVFLGFVERGALDLDALERAVAATAARHPGLRTVYRDDTDEVKAHVLDAHVPAVPVVTCGGPVTAFGDFVRAYAAERGREPFDVATAPAYRFHLIQHSEGRQALVLSAHHMLLDGWAVGLLLDEIITRHDTLCSGTPEKYTGQGVSPQALSRHQERLRAAGVWDQQAEFWIKHLDGVPPVLELPADRQRPPIQDGSGARIPIDLGAAASAEVAARSRALGITPFSFLLAAFGLTLSRWTGVNRLLVGVPLAGRDTSELTQLMAVTGNLVPVRVEVDDDATGTAYLRAVHASLSASIDAGDLPFEELTRRIGTPRSPGSHPLVQVSFGMHDQLVPEHIDTAAARIRLEEGHGGGAQFDLSFLIGRSTPALAGHLEYATALLRTGEAEAFVADFTAAVTQLAASADGRLEEVRCIDPARRTILDQINATRTEFPEVSVDELFRQVVQRAPDSLAVAEGSVRLTYAELANAAAHQAALLAEAGVKPGDRVLVGLDRSVAETVAVLGCLWAGAAYVGVELGGAAEHTDKIVVAAAASAALVHPAHARRLHDRGIPTVATWDESWGDIQNVAAPAEPSPARLAYVAFTSGSTGQPKGVCVPHRAVVRLILDPGYVRTGPAERMLRLSPLAFDASTLELWGALATGAALVIQPAGLPTPSELGDFLRAEKVSVAWLTAGLYRLVEEFAPESFAVLKQLLTGGDVVPHEHVAATLRRHPQLVVTNGYGPTENTTFTTTHTVTDPEEIDGPLPIGLPIPGTRVHVLDSRHRIVPPGAVGELYTSGLGLADGYLGDEVETARSFGLFSPDVPHRLYRTGDLVRLDTRGRVRFLGRRDDQVKLRGYRVELSAISEALRTDPRVQDAVVAVTSGDSAEKRLIAAVIPAARERASTAELRGMLAQRLPSYMVPALWAVVDRIPVTANGKVDRRALALVAGPATGTVAVAGPDRSATLAREVFTEALGRPGLDVAADTDFFAVGGNSLGAVRLVRLVKERAGVSVKVRDFLRNPTPGGLGTMLEKG